MTKIVVVIWVLFFLFRVLAQMGLSTEGKRKMSLWMDVDRNAYCIGFFMLILRCSTAAVVIHQVFRFI
jgi:hypothetical protein